MFSFSLPLTRTPTGPVTVVPKRPSLASDDDTTSSLYARLDLICRATSLHEEADKNLRVVQKTYKRHHDRQVRLAPIFKEGDEAYLDRPPLSRSAAEESAAEGYSKLLPTKQGPYRVVGVKDSTLQILQNELENTICIHRATFTSTSRHYCDGPKGKEQGSTEKEPCSKNDLEEVHQNDDNLLMVEEIVQHAG